MLAAGETGNNAIAELSGMHKMHDSSYVMIIVHCSNPVMAIARKNVRFPCGTAQDALKPGECGRLRHVVSQIHDEPRRRMTERIPPAIK